MSGEAAAKNGITPLARIVAIAEAGVQPDVMGTGPIPAVELVVGIQLFKFQFRIGYYLTLFYSWKKLNGQRIKLICTN